VTAFRLPRAVYDTVRAHGEEAYPNECCGALLGRPTMDGWRIDAAMRATNASVESPQSHFEIAPDELVRIACDARGRGLEIAGFYHSHPDHPAHWSATDLADAHWLGCCYVIVQVVRGQAASTNAFLLAGTREQDKHFEPQTVEIDDSQVDRCSP
jgi:proteasome lid subunit RPN8/RPN11